MKLLLFLCQLLNGLTLISLGGDVNVFADVIRCAGFH